MTNGGAGRRMLVVAVGLVTLQLGCDLRKKLIAEALDGAVLPAAADTATQTTETSTVMCGGSTVLTYTNKTFEVASGQALFVGGHCKVTCTNCTIKAPDGIFAGGDGNVTLTGGTLEGSNKALEASGNSTVSVSGTQIKGRTLRKGGAVITGVAGLADDGHGKKLGKGACDQLFDCYELHGQYGRVSGKVTAKIAADGHATGATYSGGTASQDVQKCMLERAKAKKVSGAGKAGNLVCDYSGDYGKGSQSLDYDEAFE